MRVAGETRLGRAKALTHDNSIQVLTPEVRRSPVLEKFSESLRLELVLIAICD